MPTPSGVLFQNPIVKPLSPNGTFMSACTATFYLTGTTTLTPPYADGALTTPLANPLLSDASGTFVAVYLNPAITYRVQIKTSTGVLISDTDPYVVVLSPTPNVIGYGADPTGNADSTAAFTSAGNAGSAVTVPPGTYKLLSVPTPSNTVTWTIASGVIFIGAGVGSQAPLPGYCINLGGSVAPIGNATATQMGLSVMAVTTQAAKREIAIAGGLYVNKGQGQVSPAADKVALFGGVDSVLGSFNIWGLNTSTIIGAGNTSNQGAWGYECDLNNHSQHYGNTGGAAGLGAPAGYGIQVTGNSDFNNSYGFGLTQAAGAGKWNRGFVVVSNCIVQADIESYSQAAKWAQLFGGVYAYGLDTINAGFTGAAIRLANQHSIVMRNAGNTADVSVAVVDSSNNLLLGAGNNVSVKLGSGSSGPVISYQNLTPVTDNTLTCGANGARWSAVWAANGTIQTSDPSLKTDISPLPSVLGLLKALEPKTFRWKIGGQDVEWEEEEIEVHDVTVDEYDHPTVEIRDGVAVQVMKHMRVETPAYDDLPVVDEAGNPVIEVTPGRAAIYDKNGVAIFPARPETRAQKSHRQPRMVKKTIKKQKLVERAGKRLHWGFLATDVKAAFDALGVDFGGYVLGEDGTHHLRPDQLIPVLWKAVQELQAEVDALKAKYP